MRTVADLPTKLPAMPVIGAHDRSVVFVDGVHAEGLSKAQELPQGIELFVGEGGRILLQLRDKAVFENALHFIFVATEAEDAAQSFSAHIEIHAGTSTRLSVVYHWIGTSKKRFSFDCTTQVHLSENACVDYFQTEESCGFGSIHSKNNFYLKKHASVDSVIFTEGGVDSQHETTLHFTEPHGFASIKGLSILHADRKASHRVEVLHEAPHCISRQYYKSILSDRACAEYDSLVWVKEGAMKSDSRQLNRNLLLSGEATALSSPKLRIENDDVAASHGSASGELSDGEIFYLQSRGIEKNEAKKLLIYGFSEEIIAEIQEKSLHAHLERVIEKWVS